jgi:hypothetical protein
VVISFFFLNSFNSTWENLERYSKLDTWLEPLTRIKVILSFCAILFKSKCYTEVQPEVNPKWEVLSEILEEVDGLSKQAAEMDPSYSNRVLVLVEDSRTCNQLKQVH